jgi:L-fuconolactonase
MPESPPDIHGNALDEWQAQSAEAPLDPEQPIIDAHHHLWDRRSANDYHEATPTHSRYLGDELIDDIVRSGHNVVDTVFIECLAMYRKGAGPLAPCGEVEFVQGVAATAESDLFGKGRRCCGATIGFADLMAGTAVGPRLDALVASGRSFRGIRQAHGFHPSPDIPENHHRTRKIEHLLGRDEFRAGFAELGARSLVFECWGYHFQMPEVADLARAFPDVKIVLDHIGGPIAIGPFAGQRSTKVFEAWQRGIEEVAACPNIVAKLGGCGMPIYGFEFEDKAQPAPQSLALATAWRPYFEFVIDAFGTDRCMFESNFPVDKVSCSYGNLWNAFKRIVADRGCDAAQKDDLFFGTAARTYTMPMPMPASDATNPIDREAT